MLKMFVKTQEAGLRLVRVTKDEAGVVSFEYVIVAACIVAAVFAAFGNSTATGIGAALNSAIAAITLTITADV